jgi:hypothetical protein
MDRCRGAVSFAKSISISMGAVVTDSGRHCLGNSGNRRSLNTRWRETSTAFSSEVETGSRKENASKQTTKA